MCPTSGTPTQELPTGVGEEHRQEPGASVLVSPPRHGCRCRTALSGISARQTVIELLVGPPRPAADGQAAARRVRAGRHRGPRRPRNCPPRWSAPSPTATSSSSRSSSTASNWRSPCSRRLTALARCRPSRSSPTSGFFDYESRYTAGLTTYFTPGPTDRRGGRRSSGSRHRRPPRARPARRVADRRDRHR